LPAFSKSPFRSGELVFAANLCYAVEPLRDGVMSRRKSAAATSLPLPGIEQK
jgi:hypothetical protein